MVFVGGHLGPKQVRQNEPLEWRGPRAVKPGVAEGVPVAALHVDIQIVAAPGEMGIGGWTQVIGWVVSGKLTECPPTNYQGFSVNNGDFVKIIW